MAYRIELTDTALADLDQVYDDTLALWSREQAEKWIEEVKSTIRSLAEMPSRCPHAPDQEAFEVEVRQILCGRGRHRNRILYTVTTDTVVVLHIRHTARDHFA